MLFIDGLMPADFFNATLRRFINKPLFNATLKPLLQAYRNTLEAWDSCVEFYKGEVDIGWTPAMNFEMVRLARDLKLFSLLPAIYYKVAGSYLVVSTVRSRGLQMN